MKQFALRFAVTCYAIMLSITGVYSKNIMLIDCSGSVAGQAANRNENSLSVIGEELDSYLRKYQFLNDTIVLQCFTDKLLSKYEVVKYDDNAVGFIKSLGYPRRGNSDIATALYAAYKETENNSSDKIVLISDGLHNNGVPEKEFLYNLSEMADKSPDKIFMLLLSEKDIHNGLVQVFDRQQGLHLIRSLSELSKFNAADTPHQSELEADKENIQTGNATDANKESDKRSEFPWMCILYVLLIILLLVLIGVIVYYCWPLFAQSNAAAIQSSVNWLYELPQWAYNIIHKLLPANMKTFMKENMLAYEQYNRGLVKAVNPEQQKLLEEFKRKTGKPMKYKYGQPDFSDIADFQAELKGGLDGNIPNGANPRSNVHLAQEEFGRQMVKDAVGRQKIADYMGKNPNDITLDDFWAYKDNALGKPNHGPFTPHETIDGKSIQLVPTNFHEAFRHNGGVSMLKSIRTYFNINV